MGYFKKSITTALFLALVLLIVYQLIGLSRQSDFKGAQIVAGKDFGAYWAAVQLFKNKKNPYVPEEIQKIQRELKCINIAPTVWNPPWTFLLLSPVLSFDFYISSYLWMFCNFVLLFLISFFVWKILTPKTVTIPVCMLAGSFCAPVFWNFAYGQLSLLVTFGLIGSF
jgi:hypothetical protein